MLTEKALHPYNKLILCFQSCHMVLADMGAKCTNPPDSFIICVPRIMCLMLHNNYFFFFKTCSYFSLSIFASVDWGILIHSFPRHNLEYFFFLGYIWSFFLTANKVQICIRKAIHRCRITKWMPWRCVWRSSDGDSTEQLWLCSLSNSF